ncbi:hypothetical protein E2C01_042649 [Portunus trituberculatus]|uniref:Uncharacterized protein n=1 Tax=Portunus trituberculatus TaxID=210409 RepID=A0A5B7FV81_PORTR|nr:hypothetical protein [Portunus trituberculatus]
MTSTPRHAQHTTRHRRLRKGDTAAREERHDIQLSALVKFCVLSRNRGAKGRVGEEKKIRRDQVEASLPCSNGEGQDLDA